MAYLSIPVNIQQREKPHAKAHASHIQEENRSDTRWGAARISEQMAGAAAAAAEFPLFDNVHFEYLHKHMQKQQNIVDM